MVLLIGVTQARNSGKPDTNASHDEIIHFILPGKPSETVGKQYVWALSRNANSDDNLGILIMGTLGIKCNSLDWDADKMYHKDRIHCNAYCYINRSADLGNRPDQYNR